MPEHTIYPIEGLPRHVDYANHVCEQTVQLRVGEGYEGRENTHDYQESILVRLDATRLDSKLYGGNDKHQSLNVREIFCHEGIPL